MKTLRPGEITTELLRAGKQLTVSVEGGSAIVEFFYKAVAINSASVTSVKLFDAYAFDVSVKISCVAGNVNYSMDHNNAPKTSTNISELSIAELNGSTSEIILPRTYVLENDGDFVEIVSRANETITGGQLLGLIGLKGTNRDFVGYSSSTNQWVISDPTAGFQNIDLNDIVEHQDFNRFRVTQTNATTWTLSVNGVDSGTLPRQDTISINNIGNAYNTTFCPCSVSYVHISTQTHSLKIDDFATQLDLYGISYTDIAFSAMSYSSGQNICIKRDTGYRRAADILEIYVPQANSDKFLKYRFEHSTDAATATDTWGIKQLSEITPIEYPLIWHKDDAVLDDNKERFLSIENAEWEMAVLLSASNQWFGGTNHNHEELTAVSIEIDGASLDLDTLRLKSGNVVKIIQASNCFEEVLADPRAIAVATSEKTWVFDDLVTLDNKLSWLVAKDISKAFLGMCSMSRSDAIGNITPWGQHGLNLENLDTSVHFSDTAKSKTKKLRFWGGPINLTVEQTKDFNTAYAEAFISSVAGTYNKLYFDFARNQSINAGDVIESKTIYTLKLT